MIDAKTGAALLSDVLDAHGGMTRWRAFEKVEATIVTGGGFFALKGLRQDPNPRRMSVWLAEQRSSMQPYGADDQRSMFTPDRIAVEKLDGGTVLERLAPRDSFAGHQMQTPWDPLHRAYFNGEALWTYLTSPFMLETHASRVDEIDPWVEGNEQWRVLRAYFPGWVETHSLVQEFFFGEDMLLRRHDYRVNIAGGFAAAQLVGDFVEVQGIQVPTKRLAYTRGPTARSVRCSWSRSTSPA